MTYLQRQLMGELSEENSVNEFDLLMPFEQSAIIEAELAEAKRWWDDYEAHLWSMECEGLL